MKSLKIILFIAILIIPVRNIFPERPEEDETIIIPSTYGWYSDDGLNISVQAWIFELENHSIIRNSIIGILKTAFDDAGEEEKTIFKERIRYFLADNHRKKDITVKIMGQNYHLPQTGANGHTNSIIKIAYYKKIKSSGFSEEISTIPGDENTKPFYGMCHIVGENGLSIISDIDDTIKISNVLNKEELIDNTFIKKFTPVKGMPELYQRLKTKSAEFHYISGSPWQLYPSIYDFLNEKKFPGGSVQLKFFRVKDKSFIDFLSADQMKYKTDAIKVLLNRFPQRKFILIGDSGEKDPEVYAGIADEFKESVKYIFIRDVGLIEKNSLRRKSIIEKAGKVKVIIFKNPAELEPYIDML